MSFDERLSYIGDAPERFTESFSTFGKVLYA